MENQIESHCNRENRNPRLAAVNAACQRLRLPEPVQGKTKLFSGEVEGLAVKLPDWVYPVVCNTATGQVQYDNFNGRWGDARSISINSSKRTRQKK